MRIIENKHLILKIDEKQSTFSLASRACDALELVNMKMNFSGPHTKRLPNISSGWESFHIRKDECKTGFSHGSAEWITLERGFPEENVKVRICFALPEDHPFMLWKLSFTNLSPHALMIDKFVMLDGGTNSGSQMRFGRRNSKANLAFFSNGWQSWCYTAAYGHEEKMRVTKLRAIQGQQWINPSTPVFKKRGRFCSDFFGVIGDRTNRTGWVTGFLSQRHQYGTITADLKAEPRLQIWADGRGVSINPAVNVETDWAYLQPIFIDEADALGVYYDAVARENQIHLENKKPSGWCSWYEFYTHIDDVKISKNLQAVTAMKDEIPLELFQIDDGYETQIGDWLSWKDTFKSGMKHHAEAVKDAGFIPGLWQAPFIVHKKSNLFKSHPDWMIRTHSGKPVNSGFNWNSFTTALDLTNREALEYVREVTETAVKDWGYEYLKLDFLYAASLAGTHADATKNRAQIIRDGMQTIRKSVGERTFLLGCGAPLGSMLGIVDGMRIGSDVLDKWKTRWFGMDFIFKDEPNTPSACNAIQNIISRSGMHNRWWYNDPDVLLIRENSRLTIEEIQSLASVIALSGGMLLLSDDLTKVGQARLKIVQKLLPQLDNRPWVLDWFDQQMASKLRVDLSGASGVWHLVSVSNWQDDARDISVTPEEIKLPDDVYWVRSFWDGELCQFSNRKPCIFRKVPPHATKVLAIRKMNTDRFSYLGGDLHISQGIEVSAFRQKKNAVEMVLDLGRHADGRVVCFSPHIVKEINMDRVPCTFDQDQDGVLSVKVDFKKSCTLEFRNS